MGEITPKIDPQQVLTDVTTELAKSAAASFWVKVKKFFKDLDAEDQIRYGEAYEEYLVNTRSKNSKVKTLIYRRMPKDLYSFYECIAVKYDGEKIDTSDINNLLNRARKTILTGTGGIGKSMLLRYLFLNTIDSTEYIPVLIELRSMNSMENKEIKLFDCIYTVLMNNGFYLEKEYFEKSMQEGGYVIFLDGFDELNREKSVIAAREIKNISDRYNKNHYILSSRPMDEFIGWNDFCEMSVCPLTKKQAISLIQKIEFDEIVKTRFLKALDEYLFDEYRSFASNPLLLTIMLMTFSNHASIPEKLNDFYEAAFTTLYNTHDATKDCYTRDIRTGLGCEDFKMVFAYLCFKSYFKNEFEFSEYKLRYYIQQAKTKFSNIKFTVDDFQDDLLLSVCMLVKDGLDYRFAHRSFQEYFAAWYTCKLMDDEQEKVLSVWMEQSTSVTTDEYLNMLFNMQPDKVNKIVFCPGIKKLKIIYEEKGFSLDLLSDLFKGVTVTTAVKGLQSFNLTIKDRYLCNIVRMACRLNGYEYGMDSRDKYEKDNAIVSRLRPNLDNGRFFDFQDVLKCISEEELLEIVIWFKRQIDFCFEVLERYVDNPIRRKKKLSSIIDEL